MTQFNNAERQLRGVTRTVCIGLGGTGHDVLMRIRRLIVDRYGDLNKLPIVSFVHIDTDKLETQKSSLRTGSIYHGVNLSFREAEKVSATMTPAEVTNFVQGLERRSSYDERPGPYDNIALWFPRQLLRNIRAVEEGAQARRPVGRLAFFHNYQNIKTAIERAEQRTRGHEAALLKAGLEVNQQKLNIFVVGSLCGGTGSGMFLDVAYSLRYAYKAQGTQIFGYLVISPELYGNTAHMKANTYAALKELNHYTTPGTKFQACYDIQNLVIVQEQRSPFDYTYLVSNKTASGYSIADKSKLCNVIAHKIALDFSGELASVVRGMRDNFASHLSQFDEHPRPNSQGYLAFGLAAIYFPRDMIVQVALNRISLKLVTFWLNGEGQSPDPQVLLERFLLNWHNDLAQKDSFTTRLEEAAQEANKTFSRTINEWRDNLDDEISACRNKDDRERIRQQLPREFREQFRKTQPGETENTRGIWLTRLQKIRPSITAQFKRDIDSFFEMLLTPSNPDFSIKITRDWLDTLQNELNTYQRNLQEQIISFGGTRRLEDLDRKWRSAEQTIEEIEQRRDLPVLGAKNRRVQAEAKTVIVEICKLIKHNFDFAITQEALQIVKALQQQVQERLTQVAAFSHLVDNLKSDYEKKEKELNEPNLDGMSGEAIFYAEDIEGYYNILLPSNEFRSQLVLVSSEITEPSGRGQSLASFVERGRTTKEQLQDEIDENVDHLFGPRSTNIVQSVIKRFTQNYSSSAAREIRLRQIMQEADLLLPLNLTDPYFRNTDSKSSKLIGFKDTDDPEVRQFKAVLTRDIGISESVFKPSQAEDEILIVNEYAGFPLRLIEDLEGMRNAYTREKNFPDYFPHNARQDIFTDIIPPDARTMEELEDIFYPCLAFEILKQNPETQQLEFQYIDEFRKKEDTFTLSPIWNLAIEQLANNPDIGKKLKNFLDINIAEIKGEPNLWDTVYLPALLQFVDYVEQLPDTDPNYPCKATVVGTRATVNTPAKEGVIERFYKRIQGQMPPGLPGR